MPRVKDKPKTIALDAIRLSKGWRSVAAASGKENSNPATYHTICVEQYAEGLRLIALDPHRVLVSFVGLKEETEEPGIDELPIASAIAIDVWGRAKSLLAHMQQQATQEENEGLEASVSLGVPWLLPDIPNATIEFDGFSRSAVNIEYPGHERLHLPVYEGAFPDWRSLISGHRKMETTALLLNQDVLATLAAATKPFGEDCKVRLSFAGYNGAIACGFGDDPTVRGLLMPMAMDETDP